MPRPAPVFFNRELSWLAFNQRVLDEGRDPRVPLLERLKFLAISSSNLNEFFMVRVGGLQWLAGDNVNKPDPAGLAPADQLRAVMARARKMVRDQYACFERVLEPALREAGIRRLAADELDAEQRDYLLRVVRAELLAIVSPAAVDPERPFPLLMNLRLHLAVRLAPAAGAVEDRYAVLPIGSCPERFLRLPAASGYSYILIEDALRLFLDDLFQGQPILEQAVFRVTRNADLDLREDLAPDLMISMEEVLAERKTSDCVRLELQHDASPALAAFLARGLEIGPDRVERIPGPLDLAAFLRLSQLDGFDRLRDPAWPPQAAPDLDLKEPLFPQLEQRAVLLHHPYDSYDPVLRFIEEAADDPQVLAIKQTLYRTSGNSPVVAALKRAAENGKYVTALVELKARFDEARNIEWARELEEAGAQVIYGVKGLKTHAKICLVVRREPQGIARYTHFGTGNYNERTARLYGDISYLSRDEDLGADGSAFFNAITGYSQPQEFYKLAAAPLRLRERIIGLIHAEIERRRQGEPTGIMIKLNSLVDPRIIQALYAASQAGVEVKLNVRGICCLVPGIKGLSQNITVVSIVDRFLEHSRICCFHHGGDEQVFISSADWMPRNLDRRVELMVPVEDPAARQQLIAILQTYFRDDQKAHLLRPDGAYEKIRPAKNRKGFRAQEYFYRQACAAVEQAAQSRLTVLQPHRPA